MQNPWLSYPDSRSRSQFKVMWFTIEFRVRSISPEPFQTFSLTSPKCSSHWDDVHNSWLDCADSRSRSHFKVMGFALQFMSAPYLLNPFNNFLRFGTSFSQMWGFDATFSHVIFWYYFLQLWGFGTDCSHLWKFGTNSSHLRKIVPVLRM